MKIAGLKNLLILIIAAQLIACGGDGTQNQKSAEVPMRIVSLNGTITETLVSLGMADEIVGVDVTSVYPESINAKPKVGHVQNISVEGIMSLNPTLIIGNKDELDRGIGGKLKAAGLRVMAIEREYSEDGARLFIKQLADSMGKSDKAKVLLEKLNFDLANVKKPDSSLRILFIYARGAGNILVGGRNTPADEMIKLIGSENVASAIEGYKPLSPEFVASVNPQVILTLNSSVAALGGGESLAKTIGIKMTEAGRKRRVVSMDGLKLLGFGPRFGEALQELTVLLNVSPQNEN